MTGGCPAGCAGPALPLSLAWLWPCCTGLAGAGACIWKPHCCCLPAMLPDVFLDHGSRHCPQTAAKSLSRALQRPGRRWLAFPPPRLAEQRHPGDRRRQLAHDRPAWAGQFPPARPPRKALESQPGAPMRALAQNRLPQPRPPLPARRFPARPCAPRQHLAHRRMRRHCVWPRPGKPWKPRAWPKLPRSRKPHALPN